ncbi:hypothetical protein GIY30_16860 [Gordonia sp. HNM0687]|uniref:AbiEi antitoxin C-terminal domain-containing protein n=1 Tax=Gordonia mangrovi TaxID=2665643 RepID=A0A6L7GSY5_9ACTN|nr:type IV toxin-antitoxin system AbiEi family antitoxin domain-containing protein [Gordonia mangrovi]MXP23010.1 hypothetical protein [Gordonia mangrovi]UVF77300.1 type IV toxin-antitoxin system AbiEi family antitoxin domain-containing protein [Gordonia mangrovi]
MTVSPAAEVPDQEALDELLGDQHGVVARRQVIELGFTASYIRRKVRRRDWVPVYPGVYVNHTGPLTWHQRAWSAVLDAQPAALSRQSAILDASTPPTVGSDGPIHIVIDRKRDVVRRPGVVVHRGSSLDDRVLWHANPPRVRFEDAVLDVAAEAASEIRAIAALADAVGSRRTTASRLLSASKNRRWMRRRAFIEHVLADVHDGTCSVLEHGYLTRVERPHGLPTPSRQEPTGVGRHGFRDVDYADLRVIVELDGRMGHDGSTSRDLDMERDLDAALDIEKVTLRIGWGQVFDRPCVTASKVAHVLRRRGWAGSVRFCPECPDLP